MIEPIFVCTALRVCVRFEFLQYNKLERSEWPYLRSDGVYHKTSVSQKYRQIM